MKTVKIIMMIVSLMTATWSYANEPSILIIKNDISNTTLVIENVNEGALVSVKNNLGHILYRESVRNSGTYSKGFDLTAFPDGQYSFEFDGVTSIRTIPFLIKSKKIFFDKTKETVFYKPVTELEDNLLLISKKLNNLESLKIELFYEGNSGNYELINSETINNTKSVKRIYRLSNYKKGKYKIVYKTSSGGFTEYINFSK